MQFKGLGFFPTSIFEVQNFQSALKKQNLVPDSIACYVVSTWREQKLNGRIEDNADTYEDLELVSKVAENKTFVVPMWTFLGGNT